MALSQSALLDLVEELKTTDASELMRRMLATMLQELIDAEASAFIGALPHERSDARTTQRNGTRDKVVTTGVGAVNVKIPKTRTGSFFPALLARAAESTWPCTRDHAGLHRGCLHPSGR